MSSFSVRPYEPGDEEQVLRVFNTVFGEGNPDYQPRTMETWRHLYLGNPYGTHVLVAENADGDIIANYSAHPAPATVEGHDRLCSQPVDTCVLAEYRGSLRKKSVFVVCATEFIGHYADPGCEEFCDYLFGLPNDKAFPVGTRIIGYKPVHVPMRAHVRALEPDGGAAWLEELGTRAEGVTVEPLPAERWGEAAALFEAHRDGIALGIRREEPYLRWRYAPRPDGTRYEALLARRDGEPRTVLFYRLGWHGHPIVPLLDWIGDVADPALVAALIASIVGFAGPQGATEVLSWVTPCSPLHAVLLDLGMTLRDSPFNLCIMTFSELFDLAWAKQNWFLTMGDSDIY